MKKIYLIRHGETESNRRGIFRGRLDIPLSETGKKQSESIREYFKDIDIEIVFSSPLTRALETAETAFGQKLIIKKEELINNLDLGDWSGVEKESIRKNFPEKWKIWKKSPEKIKFPNGETLKDVYQRAELFLNKISKISKENIAVVSHRSVIKIILSAALGIKENYFWKFHLDNASISTLIDSEDRGFTLYNLNYTSHLNSFIIEWF
jgi:broad specificity phosphatase PhoE